MQADLNQAKVIIMRLERENAELAKQQKCLAEIKAEAGRAGYLQGHMDAGGINNDWSAKRSERFAEEYAAKINNAGTWLRDENVNGGKRQGGEK
jgi:hypothetical protein